MPPPPGDRRYGQHVPPGAAQGQHGAVASESGGDIPKHPPGVQGYVLPEWSIVWGWIISKEWELCV